MERFTFTNAMSESIVIGDHRDDFLLSSHSGTSSAEILTTARKGYSQNGQFFVKNNLGTRILNIEFTVRRRADFDFYRIKREICAVFNPLLGEGLLTYKNDYTEKAIKAVVTAMPVMTEKSKILGRVTVELTAHNPFWFDLVETSQLLEGVTGGLSFPLEFTSPGVTLALKGSTATITSDSDTDIPITAEFSGACVNPVFSNTTTNKRIAIQTSIADGEKIIVTTEYGNKNVYKVSAGNVRTNVNNLITDDTVFFSLIPGDNRLSFSADSGTPGVYLHLRNLYTGI